MKIMTNINGDKIVITGVGAITPLGGNIDYVLTNLRNGISGISKFHTREDLPLPIIDQILSLIRLLSVLLHQVKMASSE